MSGATENTDPLAVQNSSIHLNEEDCLRFLQKLTPTSIENLQQTLKRLQQRDSLITSPDKLSFLATASQLCGSSLVPSSTAETALFANQTAPIVMSLGVSKATVPSVITVPPILNVAKSVPNAMSNTIVLPSSTLLITPSGHGQAFSLDPGLNRLVVTSGDLFNAASGSSGPSVPSSLSSPLTSSSSSSEAFNSLNTLATAAVAFAANSAKQDHWSSGSGCPTKPETSSQDVVTSFPQVFNNSSVPCTASTTSSSNPVSTTAITNNSRQSTSDSLFSSLFHAQSDLSTQLLPSLKAAGITVYPVQVSANGPTMLVAASPSSIATTIDAKSLLNRAGLVTVPAVIANTNTGTNTLTTVPTSCCSLTCSATTSTTSAAVITTIPHITNVTGGTCVFSGNTLLSPSVSVTASTNSPSRSKPKFKALWESSLDTVSTTAATITTTTTASVTTVTTSSDAPRTVPAVPTDSPGTINVGADPVLDQVNLLVANPVTTRHLNHSMLTKRQSPILIGSKSIGQTPKRLAASAASAAASASRCSPSSCSLSPTTAYSGTLNSVIADSENKSLNQFETSSKKLLLVCSQNQQQQQPSQQQQSCAGSGRLPNTAVTTTGAPTVNTFINNTQTDTLIEPIIAKVVTSSQSRGDSEQSELVFLTNPNINLSDGLSTGPTGAVQSQNTPGSLFVPNRGATVVLVNHNANTLNTSTSTMKTPPTTTTTAPVTGGIPDPTRNTPPVVPMSVSDSEISTGPVSTGSQNFVMDISKRIMRTDEMEQVGDDEARRRAKRRERNRVAAAKCRQRRQDQIMRLQYQVDSLKKAGQDLCSSIQSLDEERARLVELIQQHGLAGCSEVDDFLASLATVNDLNFKEEQNTSMEIEDNEEEEMNFGTTGAFGYTEDILMTNAVQYPNSGPTTSCSSPTSPSSRNPTKSDLDPMDVGQHVTTHLEQQRLLRPASTSASITVSINGTVTTIKQDQFDVAEPSPVDSGSDGSESRQIKAGSSQSSCHSPPITKTRLVVARPCTLLPPKCTLEPVSNNSNNNNDNTTVDIIDSTKAAMSVPTAATSTSAITTANANNAAATPTTLETPIISRLWPSKLQQFSPILTPSAWKMIPKDCSSICVNPNGSTPTATSGSAVTNSSVAAAAAALLLSSPSLTSSLTNPGSTANLLVSSLVDSINTAAATAAVSGGAILSTPSAGAGDLTASINSTGFATTPLFCLPEVIGVTTSASSNQPSFVISPMSSRDRTEQHASEKLNATITQ